MPGGSTCRVASTDASETTYPLICPTPHFSRIGTDGWSRAIPPPTAMKSLWQAAVACCAALKSAASRSSITMWRPLMPPEALHQSANALACWTNSTSSPGSMVLAASLNTAMLMVFGLTPRTEEAPPGPGSQILPTPGQTPSGADPADNVRLIVVAAEAAGDERTTPVPATIITVVIASGSTDLRSPASPLQNMLTLPTAVCDRVIQSAPGMERGSPCTGQLQRCLNLEPWAADTAWNVQIILPSLSRR